MLDVELGKQSVISSFLCTQAHISLVPMLICCVISWAAAGAAHQHVLWCNGHKINQIPVGLSSTFKNRRICWSTEWNYISLRLPFPSSADTLSLHRVWALSEASCVTQQDGESTYVQCCLYYVPGGAGNGRHNGCRSLAWMQNSYRVVIITVLVKKFH